MRNLVVGSSLPALTRKLSRVDNARRLKRLRVNWFALGSVFGLSFSFIINGITGSSHDSAATAQAITAAVEHSQPTSEREPTAAPAKSPAKTNSKQSSKNEATSLPPPPVLAELAVPPQMPAPAPQVAQEPKLPPLPPLYPMKLALQLGKGDTLLDVLLSKHVQPADAKAAIEALGAKVNPNSLKAGQRISVTLQRHETIGDMAAVKELAIKLPNLSTVELMRLQNGGFDVAATEDNRNAKTFRGFGRVRSSILQAGAQGGIPAAALNEVIHAFSYDVDFQREIHPGDTIEVLIDRKKTKNGYTTQGGTVRYAALTLSDGKHEIFRFKDANGNLAWFDGAGGSIKKSLLRTPVDAVHITSGFGMRTHPIMGYSKMHRGVDFGAPTGTPIMAAGDGVVTYRGWKGGYGNFVVIKHNAKYETAYGHISRFAKISVGQRVRQGQVIAYVGATGMATGPHLHYEVHENDIQVNPIAKQFNMAAGLSGKQLAAFKSAKQSAMNELASLAKKAANLASR